MIPWSAVLVLNWFELYIEMIWNVLHFVLLDVILLQPGGPAQKTLRKPWFSGSTATCGKVWGKRKRSLDKSQIFADSECLTLGSALSDCLHYIMQCYTTACQRLAQCCFMTELVAKPWQRPYATWVFSMNSRTHYCNGPAIWRVFPLHDSVQGAPSAEPNFRPCTTSNTSASFTSLQKVNIETYWNILKHLEKSKVKTLRCQKQVWGTKSKRCIP